MQVTEVAPEASSVKQLTNAERGMLKDEFESLDKNKDGKLELSEWTSNMKKYGLTAAEAETAFKAWDLDTSSGITFDEYERMMGDVIRLKKRAVEHMQAMVEKQLGGAETKKATNQMGKRVACQSKFCCWCCLCCPCVCASMYMGAKAVAAPLKASIESGEEAGNKSAAEIKQKLLSGPGTTSMERS